MGIIFSGYSSLIAQVSQEEFNELKQALEKYKDWLNQH